MEKREQWSEVLTIRDFWKRDEAVLLVREGSIVVGASRYEPRLRCIISCVHIIDAAVHLRSRSTPYPTRIRSLRRRPFPRRKRRRVGGASVPFHWPTDLHDTTTPWYRCVSGA